MYRDRVGGREGSVAACLVHKLYGGVGALDNGRCLMVYNADVLLRHSSGTAAESLTVPTKFQELCFGTDYSSKSRGIHTLIKLGLVTDRLTAVRQCS